LREEALFFVKETKGVYPRLTHQAYTELSVERVQCWGTYWRTKSESSRTARALANRTRIQGRAEGITDKFSFAEGQAQETSQFGAG